LTGNFQKIVEGFFIYRSPEKDFHRNVYFKVFKGLYQNKNIILDPGTNLDLSSVLKICEKIFGGHSNIDFLFLSHQDPDVSSSIPKLLKLSPHLKIISSIDTWRLIKMYDVIPETTFIPIEKIPFFSKEVTIKGTKEKVRFIPAPYCHFRGSYLLYDFTTKILFTGDFLSGVNIQQDRKLFAEEDDWKGIKIFHEIYMPSSYAIKTLIDRIFLLNPFPEIFAPQHGKIIPKNLAIKFMDRLYNMKMGIDIMKNLEIEKDLVIIILNKFLEKIKELFPTTHEELIDKLKYSENFTSPFTFVKDTLMDLKLTPEDSIEIILETIHNLNENRRKTREILLKLLSDSGIVIPEKKTEEDIEKIIMDNFDI